MLTIFTIPKPFEGHIDVIQRNAIESWLRLRPACEVILFGNDAGVAEVAAELGIRHVPDISTTEYGTPLVSVAFEQAQQIARHPLLCYSNADIVFLDDLLIGVRRNPFKKFVMVGRRWDVDITHRLDAESPGYVSEICQHIRQGKRHPATGSDYFLFPRGIISQMPPFAVGRPAWDNWLIQYACLSGIPLIDMSNIITVVHQDHDYSHVPQGDFSKTWDSPEADYNYKLVGEQYTLYTLGNASHVMIGRIPVPKWILDLPGNTKQRVDLLRSRLLMTLYNKVARYKAARRLYRTIRPRKQDTN